jgi:hypothetical protein
MCMFSQEVDRVEHTQIFCRGAGDRQLLVYQMVYAARTDLAMVLPLPVPAGSGEDAVRFIDLRAYPTFFDDLDSGFPSAFELEAGAIKDIVMSADLPLLEVHAVGDFEASFVPTMADFARLDPRFRLSDDVWRKLPGYHDHGFAVFKLRAHSSHSPPAGADDDELAGQRPHPMAFEFPRRDRSRLFFPTAHVHDGTVYPFAEFGHTLYYQIDPALSRASLPAHMGTEDPVSAFTDVERAKGVLDPESPCFRFFLSGSHENMDCILGEGGALPRSQSTVVWHQWVSASPPCLRCFKVLQNPYHGSRADLPAMEEALRASYSEALQRTSALLSWFGSGVGSWAGYPSYEEVAHQLLLRVDITDILEVLDSPLRNDSHLEGAARLLAGAPFRWLREADLSRLSDAHLETLRWHSARLDDEYRHLAAEAAFGKSRRKHGRSV